MIFHENRLSADDSHEISYHIFFRKLSKMSQNLLSAAVVIGALRINTMYVVGVVICNEFGRFFTKKPNKVYFTRIVCRQTIVICCSRD